MGDKMQHERRGDTIRERIKGEVTERAYDQVEIIAPSNSGSGNVIGRVIEKDGKMTQVVRGGIQVIGGNPDWQKHVIAAQAANKVEVFVKFSDYSRKHEGKYRLKDTVYDIIADILVGKKISHICDSETGLIIDEDTKISALHKKNRLDKLKAVVVKQYRREDTNEKQIDDDVTERTSDIRFPCDEVSEYVGSEGKTINIGECSVTFPPGCFEKTQKVTVSVSINPDKWPHGKVGITPTLHVKAHDLKVPAIVKMKTWCVDDDDEDLLVEVLRFGEDEKDWNIAHLCQLGQSRDIEFQVSHFSKFLAVLKKIFLSYYALRSIVCFDNDKFAIATVLDDKTAKQNCIKKLKKKIANDATINSYNPFHCKYSSAIRSRIFSKHQESDFTFTPTEVEHTVQRVNQCRGSFKSYLILESKKEPTEVTLSFHVFANKTRLENQAFKYFWRPVKHRPTSEQTESNFPGTSAGNFHAGGDMHLHFDGRKTTGVENHGEMTSHNEGCSEAISG